MARATGIEDISTLQAALIGFQIEKQRIEASIQSIRAQLKGRRLSGAAVSGAEAKPVVKRELSAAARNRIAMAQKKRWAEHRKRAAQAAKAQSAKAQSAKAG